MPRRKQQPTPSTDAADSVSADLVALQAEIESARQGWQRTQADFENFRRRTLDQQQERISTEVGRALLGLAPVAENLRRAISEFEKLSAETTSTDQLAAWATGVVSIARQFDQALASTGLNPIDPQPGERFNPHEHEALTHQPHADHDADTIVQVVERGYKAGARVLSPAKVIVSSGKA